MTVGRSAAAALTLFPFSDKARQNTRSLPRDPGLVDLRLSVQRAITIRSVSRNRPRVLGVNP
jgi:hypothetical protein